MSIQRNNTSRTSAYRTTIMVVEDDPNLREAIVDTLELGNYCVVAADSGEEALKQLMLNSEVALVVSDVNMGGMDGHELLREIKRNHAHIPVILNTAYGSIDRSVEAMRDGAVDYLVKPFAPELLLETVSRYIGGQNTADEPIAADPSSQQLLTLARRVAESDSTVLIIGESGTGKEVLARYVHQHSPRAQKPFIAINCAAIPENMLEAMLFGHEKGAYTGAHSSAPGKFEQANGGTILLDEISEMDMSLQAKLLRVLQEREVERLGGRKTIQLDVRVIATSNRDMRRHVAEGKFREDLYFRLSVLPLQWAPLRDRPADIIPLAEQLLSRHAQKQYRKGVKLSDQVKQAMLSYPWPGNVRELDNVMQRALILQTGATIHPADLGLAEQTCYSEKPSLLAAAVTASGFSGQAYAEQPRGERSAVESNHFTARDQGLLQVPVQPFQAASQYQAAPQYAERSYVTEPSAGQAVPALDDAQAGLGDDLKQREFEIIVSTLRQEGGSKKGTAERLGISPRTLRYKIARLKEQGFDLQVMCT